jgi:long-chain acyl-CoA synthetase
LITRDPLVEQALVVAESKPYAAALLVLEPKAWGRLASELCLDPEDPMALQARRARGRLIERISGLLSDLPAHAQVRAVHLTLQPWTVDEGLLTPTMKVKRGPIEQRFADEIRSLYAGHDLAA